jgi:hypothetical protein
MQYHRLTSLTLRVTGNKIFILYFCLTFFVAPTLLFTLIVEIRVSGTDFQ